MNKPLVLITGKDGQLGYELSQIQENYSQFFDFLIVGRNELNLENTQEISEIIAKKNPKYFINCAAYTAVDKAETEKELAMAINATAPKAIAKACAAIDCNLIHISTDYVFDGNQQQPYLPLDLKNPINHYGLSKSLGEEAVLNNNNNSIIIRTSWVYSNHGKNFVKTMIQLMKTKESISVVNDQKGSPTYAKDLAVAILEIIKFSHVNKQQLKQKIYQFSNQGIISWFDFALEISKNLQSNCVVNATSSTSYPTPAKRSSYSAMYINEIFEDFNLEKIDWKTSLKNCIQIIDKQ
jgi:dTDP-4-dehydrorhamnose reductase